MNPTKRLNLITDIALKLQAGYNTTGINLILGGYNIITSDVTSVSSKRAYVIDLLKSQPNDVIIKIAQDLDFDVKDLSQPDSTFNVKTMINQKRIFISHSSKDKDVVEKVIDTLEAIGVPSSNIFCSSFPGYGVNLGADFLETIKNELNSNVLVIFILSSNFYTSVISLCEMGATWVKTNEHIPILIPPFDYKDIRGVIPTTHGMKINEKEKFNLLKEKVEGFLEINPLHISIWERKRDNILKEIGTVLNNKTYDEIKGTNDNNDIRLTFMVGWWVNEWTENGQKWTEHFEIKNDGRYIIDGIHVFNVENFNYDINRNQITFTKVGAQPNDSRRLINKLVVISNELLTGTENNINIMYTKR